MRTTLCLLLLSVLSACGGGGSSALNTSNPTNSAIISGTNVAPLIVDAGPAALSSTYIVNEVFTSVTICDSLNHCQKIDHILVDTGSSGLRIMSSVLSSQLNLTQQTDSSANPIGECGMFVDGYTWGPVKLATVKLANQTANGIPIQVIGDSSFALVPTACANTGTPENTVAAFGANGVLGVGYFLQDCGKTCISNANLGIYYSCPASGCVSTTMTLSQQVPNPVSQFASDNNGVMLSLPTVSATGDSNVAGSLVFGINTQANNDMSGTQILTVNQYGFVTTVFNGQTMSNSFIDSGSNGLYFPSSTLATCPNYTYFYCPPTTQNYTATLQGGNANPQVTIDFSVANATSLFNTRNTAFDNLAGTGVTGSFDWGLPFFYGRKVFVAIEGQNVGGSTGPFVAF